jgi:hypothetical protein
MLKWWEEAPDQSDGGATNANVRRKNERSAESPLLPPGAHAASRRLVSSRPLKTRIDFAAWARSPREPAAQAGETPARSRLGYSSARVGVASDAADRRRGEPRRPGGLGYDASARIAEATESIAKTIAEVADEIDAPD